tara:strand:+ start:659 stop:967 length:309 start_codon:yes stop_codon:yes gene_type:complete
MSATSAMDDMLAGNFTAGILGVYTGVFVPTPLLFYALIWAGITISLYITTQDITIPAIISLIMGQVLVNGGLMMSEGYRIGWLITVFSLAAILFKIRSRKRV